VRSRQRKTHPVVVITGASSGIGRETAHEFARNGARLMLAARSRSSLEEAAAECAALGGEAEVHVTDVSDERQVRKLVDATVARFGRVDVWVGAASLFCYGRFEDVPPDVFRRMIEVNLFGQVHGARAVLPQLRRQGGGSIILIGSVYSRVATPYVSAYITSKHAVAGFAESLRQETREDGIDVSLVLPSTADTPIYQHAANFTGHATQPLPPRIAPERVARAIVDLADSPRPAVVVGQSQRVAIPLQRWMPRLYGTVALWAMRHLALRPQRARPSEGTLFEPQPESNAVRGGWS
jgi:NAD(P)-dependent dehydrogenase (short-subunit alcohol dehydrogenase family)